ncbi:hypothetical protein AB2B41_12210 [Marimonas sp. MJW-29]|uniref:Uncharacterized protein n=1 Tax=Sulfitobacter sediminis TaxID=3234186 RepID=A0ABV3RNX9_9RHOB
MRYGELGTLEPRLTDVFQAIGAICDLYEPAECRNYFRAAGYAAG